MVCAYGTAALACYVSLVVPLITPIVYESSINNHGEYIPMLETIIHHLPSVALLELARKYEADAKILRMRAAHMHQKEQTNQAYERQQITREKTVKMVFDMVEHERKSYDAALHAASRFSGIPALTIEFEINKLMKKRDRRARLAKDAAVMGLIRAGHSNEVIAGRLRMHPNTVSNIKNKVMNP